VSDTLDSGATDASVWTLCGHWLGHSVVMGKKGVCPPADATCRQTPSGSATLPGINRQTPSGSATLPGINRQSLKNPKKYFHSSDRATAWHTYHNCPRFTYSEESGGRPAPGRERGAKNVFGSRDFPMKFLQTRGSWPKMAPKTRAGPTPRKRIGESGSFSTHTHIFARYTCYGNEN
jgi:hypothetical protein